MEWIALAIVGTATLALIGYLARLVGRDPIPPTDPFVPYVDPNELAKSIGDAIAKGITAAHPPTPPAIQPVGYEAPPEDPDIDPLEPGVLDWSLDYIPDDGIYPAGYEVVDEDGRSTTMEA